MKITRRGLLTRVLAAAASGLAACGQTPRTVMSSGASGINSSVAFSPNAETYIRCIKNAGYAGPTRGCIEVWQKGDNELYHLLEPFPDNIATFPAYSSGEPGPKRKEGDKKVPEGFYMAGDLNPESRYHLSFGISYPNSFDDKRSEELGENTGGAIVVHGENQPNGGVSSRGCFALYNARMDKLYDWMEQLKHKRKNVRIDIFPYNMSLRKHPRLHPLTDKYGYTGDLAVALQTAWDFFERTRTLPKVSVTAQGHIITSPEGEILHHHARKGPLQTLAMR
jgi:murein L,D-transpeptidase YafK